MALVTKLFPEQDYGFIRSLDGRDIYFHRNSVLHDDYDRLEVGTGVRYVEQSGEMGPQERVQIVDKPGVRVDSAAEQPPVEAPLGWQ
ncbi:MULTISPECIES: cold-shock protein [Aerosakkonema]|uniref:cold-shock protein n=1 Tax=Aerosakkonema TaxID=1246629 RepID=UPI0035B6D405